MLDSKNTTVKEQQHRKKTATELRCMYTEAEFGKTTELPRYNSEIGKKLHTDIKTHVLALWRARKFANLWIKLQNVFPTNTYIHIRTSLNECKDAKKLTAVPNV